MRKNFLNFRKTICYENVVNEILPSISPDILPSSLKKIVEENGGKGSKRIYPDNILYKDIEQFLNQYYSSTLKKGYCFVKKEGYENYIFIYRWRKYKKSVVFDGKKLSNQVRVFSVHKKQQPFYPSKNQSQAIMLYTMDVLAKLFIVS